MNLRLAMAGLLCLGVMSGSAYAVTAGANTPAPEPAPTASTDENADANAAPADDGNPYSAIIRANVFKLTEPPKPIAQVDPAILNLPKVNMTGFKRREGEPIRALFATVPKDPKDQPRYFNLAEGEKEDILEVKHIDPSQESVDVIIAGTPVTLNVKSNSFVQPVVVPKAGAPGAPNTGIVARPPGPVPIATPNPAPTANNNAAPYGGGVVIAGGSGSAPAGGSSVTTIGGGQAQPNYGGGGIASSPPPGVVTGGGTPIAPASATDSALRSIPTRGIRTPNYTPGQYQPQSLQEAQVHAAVYNEINVQGNQGGPPAPE